MTLSQQLKRFGDYVDVIGEAYELPKIAAGKDKDLGHAIIGPGLTGCSSGIVPCDGEADSKSLVAPFAAFPPKCPPAMNRASKPALPRVAAVSQLM